MTISFSKDLETGIKAIDDQHKELINKVNALSANKSFTKDDIQKTITILADYVVQHFADEQALHTKYNYPKAAAHKALHDNFIAEIEKIKKEFRTRDDYLKFSLEIKQTAIT